MSLRKMFTKVKENMLENLCTEEMKRKIGRGNVKIGNYLSYSYTKILQVNFFGLSNY